MAGKLNAQPWSLETAATPAANDEPLELARRRRVADMYILDRSFRVVLTWISGREEHSILNPDRATLRENADRVVRRIVAQSGGVETFAMLPPSLMLRIGEIDGSAGPHICVFAEPFQSRDALREASRRYQITRRETEVLTLLVQGSATTEIAAALSIQESTVQDHIKNIAAKTNSRNRTEIVAKVLGPGL
jgi:DNA-binding CsgD family transcriptional regulator